MDRFIKCMQKTEEIHIIKWILLYELGETVAESGNGNQIVVYDKEWAVCDAVINRKKMDMQMFQTAMKEYMSDSGRR